jgi:hypothetical protein
MLSNEGPQGSRCPGKVNVNGILFGLQEPQLEIVFGNGKLVGLNHGKKKLPVGIPLDKVIFQATGPNLIFSM